MTLTQTVAWLEPALAATLAVVGVVGTLATAWASRGKSEADEAAANAPVELAEVKAKAARDKDESKRFTHQAALAERLLEERESEIERERNAHDRTRQKAEMAEHQAAMYMTQNEQLLFRAELAEQDAAKHRSCLELVESQNGKITATRVALAICETEHKNAKAHVEWLEARVDKLDGGREHNPSIPPPPARATPMPSPRPPKEQA